MTGRSEGSDARMSGDQDAAVDAASRAIEAMPRREWPYTPVDTSAYGSPPAKTVTVSYQRADRDPTPVPQDLPAGWTTVEQLKAQLKGQEASGA